MENLTQLYNSIQNPMSNELIGDLLSAFSNASGAYYNELTNLGGIQQDTQQINPDDKTAFETNLWNMYKKAITSASPEFVAQRVADGDTNYPKLQQFFSSIPEFKTLADIKKARENDIVDSWAENAFSELSGWEHIQSRELRAKRLTSAVTEHRLYVKCDSLDLYKVANEFMKKASEQKLPFYFKFDESAATRDDRIIIYSDKANLIKYINILEEIAKENPEIVQRAGKPPALTGLLNLGGFQVGFGDEPRELNIKQKSMGKEKYSYNSLRSDIIEKAINNAALISIENCRGKTFLIDGKQQKFNDVLLNAIAKKAIKSKLSVYTSHVNKKQGFINQHGADAYEKQRQSILNRYGLTENDLTSQSLQDHVVAHLRKGMAQLISELKSESINKKGLDIPSLSGKGVGIHIPASDDLLRIAMPILMQCDDSLVDLVTEELKKQSAISGVDFNKFCFDIGTKEKFEAFDKANPTKAQDVVAPQPAPKNEPAIQPAPQVAAATPLDKTPIDSQPQIDSGIDGLSPESLKIAIKNKDIPVAPDGIYKNSKGGLGQLSFSKDGSVTLRDTSPKGKGVLATGDTAIVKDDRLHIVSNGKSVFSFSVADYAKIGEHQSLLLSSSVGGRTAYQEVLASGLAKIGDKFERVAQNIQRQQPKLGLV